MNKLRLIILLWIGIAFRLQAQPIQTVINKFLAEHNHFQQAEDVWGNYTLDMSVEAIINYSIISTDTSYLDVIERFFSQKNYAKFELGDKHGPPAVIYALTAVYLNL